MRIKFLCGRVIYPLSLFVLFTLLSSLTMAINIIPQPVSVVAGEGSFILDKNAQILDKSAQIVSTDSSASRAISFFKDYLAKYYDLELNSHCRSKSSHAGCRSQSSHDGSAKISFVLVKVSRKESEALSRPDGYVMDVSSKGVTIEASGAEGFFYAVQSLIQLLPVKGGTLQSGENTCNDAAHSCSHSLLIPAVRVEDYPRFGYRGMHLDVVRHIFPVDYIKKYIDYLALHKMNYFHWHLTDDQGWRMESKSHPRLNEYGSWRDGTIIGLFPGTGVDSTRYGGFYTVEQLKEIVDYAAERFITVVPEIDIPGHSMAILAAYPQFSTTPHIPKKPAITWGIYNRQNNVLAPSEEVFAFLEDVFNELMDVFPSKYIHIGADECSKRWWEQSASVKEFMEKNNIADLNQLQRYFAERVARVIHARGREFIGWDEMVDDGLVDGAIVMSWRSEKGGLEAVKQGHRAIMTPMKRSYLNTAQKEKEDSLCHNRWFLPIEFAYSYDPVPDSLSAAEASLIMGGQGCMWTEYFPTISTLEYGLFPRFSAISEVYWSQASRKDWNSFAERLKTQRLRYKLWGTNYCDHIFKQLDGQILPQ